jgi:hypothetical protein
MGGLYSGARAWDGRRRGETLQSREQSLGDAVPQGSGRGSWPKFLQAIWAIEAYATE